MIIERVKIIIKLKLVCYNIIIIIPNILGIGEEKRKENLRGKISAIREKRERKNEAN